MKSALAYVPLGSIAGTVLAIFYVNGYFVYAGNVWLTGLGIGDYFSLCLPVLPALLLGVFAGLSTWNDSRMMQLEREARAANASAAAESNERPLPQPPKLYLTKADWKKELLALLAVMLATWVFTFVQRNVPPQTSYLTIVAALGSTLVLAFALFVFSLWRDLMLGFFAVGAFALCSLSFSVGQMTGSRPFIEPPNMMLSLSDGGARCVWVMALSRSGPIVVEGKQTAGLINWSSVSGVSHSPNCVSETPRGA